jgi:hypothetical protein
MNGAESYNDLLTSPAHEKLILDNISRTDLLFEFEYTLKQQSAMKYKLSPSREKLWD